jgi:hypothetical protein
MNSTLDLGHQSAFFDAQSLATPFNGVAAHRAQEYRE